SGAPCRLRLVRTEGPTRFRRGAESAALGELVVVESRRSTTLARADGLMRVATVEHLLAALAAAGAREGVLVEIDGPEIPLADGGARVFADALAELSPPPAPTPTPLRVARAASFAVGDSRYD